MNEIEPVNKSKKFSKKEKDEIEANRKFCIFYARVSTQKQADKNESIPTQFFQMEKIAKEHGLTCIDRYSDEGISGTKFTEREDYMKMLEDIDKKKRWGITIICYSLDRLGRSAENSMYIQGLLKYNRKCRIIGIIDGADSNKQGDNLTSNIRAVVNEIYVDDLKKKIKDGMDRMINEERLITKVPFGYIKDNETRLFHVEEEQMKVVNLIRDMVERRMKVSEIVKYLNNNGYNKVINNNKNDKKNGALFNAPGIKYIMKNYAIGDENINEVPVTTRIDNWNKVAKPKHSKEETILIEKKENDD